MRCMMEVSSVKLKSAHYTCFKMARPIYHHSSNLSYHSTREECLHDVNRRLSLSTSSAYHLGRRREKLNTMTETGAVSTGEEVNLTADTITELRNNTFAIVDNFLSLDLANRLLSEAESLNSNGKFKQHYFQFGASALAKPAVYELDLSAPDDAMNKDIINNLGSSSSSSWRDIIDQVGPAFVKTVDEFDKQFDASNSSSSCAPALSLDTTTRPAIKIQINTGGGSFPWHYDNPGPPNQRALTCVVYLNPRWKHGDGGEIVLWPFLSKPTTISPLHCRAVLFYSDRVLHRVLPSKVRRVCFTIWSVSNDVNSKKDVALSKDVLQFRSYDEAATFFANSPLQRVISRAVYSEEYLESLLECIEGSSREKEGAVISESIISAVDKEKVIKQHNASVQSIVSKLRPLIEEFRRRKECIANQD